MTGGLACGLGGGVRPGIGGKPGIDGIVGIEVGKPGGSVEGSTDGMPVGRVKGAVGVRGGDVALGLVGAVGRALGLGGVLCGELGLVDAEVAVALGQALGGGSRGGGVVAGRAMVGDAVGLFNSMIGESVSPSSCCCWYCSQ